MTRRPTTAAARAAWPVSLALLVAGCGYGGMQDLPLPGSPDVGDSSFEVTADFEDVLNLATRSTVKVDGVTVGRVEEIARHGWQARVTLRLHGDTELPDDVTARIAQTSLLGEKYVDLRVPPAEGDGQADAAALGGGDLLSDGDHIEVRDTSRGREVEEVLGALALLLNGGGLGQIRTVTTELDAALQDDDSVRRFLEELDSFVGALDRNRSRIIRVMENVDRLARTVAEDRETVTAALDEITPAVRVLARQRKQLVGLLEQLDGFASTASAVVRKSGADIAADLRALEPVLAQLARAGDDLPRAIEAVLSFPFPDEVLEAVEGDYVNLDVLMELSPTTLAGNVVGDDEQLDELPGSLPDLLGLSGSGSGSGKRAEADPPRLIDLILGGGR